LAFVLCSVFGHSQGRGGFLANPNSIAEKVEPTETDALNNMAQYKEGQFVFVENDATQGGGWSIYRKTGVAMNLIASNQMQLTNEKGEAEGYAPLGPNVKVPDNFINYSFDSTVVSSNNNIFTYRRGVQVAQYTTVTDSLEKLRQDLDLLEPIDEDDFLSDSDTRAPTQQSAHRYIDRRDSYLSQLGNIRKGMTIRFNPGNTRTVRMDGGTFLDWDAINHQYDPHTITGEDPLTFSYIMSDGSVPSLNTGYVPDPTNATVITNKEYESNGAVSSTILGRELAHRLYINPLTGDKKLLLAQHQWNTAAELLQKIQTEEIIVPAELASYEYVGAILVSETSANYQDGNNSGILMASEFGSVIGSGGSGSAEALPYKLVANDAERDGLTNDLIDGISIGVVNSLENGGGYAEYRVTNAAGTWAATTKEKVYPIEIPFRQTLNKGTDPVDWMALDMPENMLISFYNSSADVNRTLTWDQNLYTGRVSIINESQSGISTNGTYEIPPLSVALVEQQGASIEILVFQDSKITSYNTIADANGTEHSHNVTLSIGNGGGVWNRINGVNNAEFNGEDDANWSRADAKGHKHTVLEKIRVGVASAGTNAGSTVNISFTDIDGVPYPNSDFIATSDFIQVSGAADNVSFTDKVWTGTEIIGRNKSGFIDFYYVGDNANGSGSIIGGGSNNGVVSGDVIYSFYGTDYTEEFTSSGAVTNVEWVTNEAAEPIQGESVAPTLFVGNRLPWNKKGPVPDYLHPLDGIERDITDASFDPLWSEIQTGDLTLVESFREDGGNRYYTTKDYNGQNRYPKPSNIAGVEGEYKTAVGGLGMQGDGGHRHRMAYANGNTVQASDIRVKGFKSADNLWKWSFLGYSGADVTDTEPDHTHVMTSTDDVTEPRHFTEVLCIIAKPFVVSGDVIINEVITDEREKDYAFMRLFSSNTAAWATGSEPTQGRIAQVGNLPSFTLTDGMFDITLSISGNSLGTREYAIFEDGVLREGGGVSSAGSSSDNDASHAEARIDARGKTVTITHNYDGSYEGANNSWFKIEEVGTKITQVVNEVTHSKVGNVNVRESADGYVKMWGRSSGCRGRMLLLGGAYTVKNNRYENSNIITFH